MNEDQASALFAPARERPVPPAAFTMADVFAADLRYRQRRRAAAVSGIVLVVVLAVVGFFALSGTGTPRAVTPEVTPTPTGLSLGSLLDQIAVPPNAITVANDPTGAHPAFGLGPGFQQLDRYWTSQLTPLEAITALTQHPPAGLVGPGRPTVETIGGRIDQNEQFDAPETAAVDGPHLLLDAQELPSGLTALSAHVWGTVKQAKTPDEVITGTVTSVRAGIGFNRTLLVATVTGVRAQRLADDVNGLWVKLTPESSCGAPAPQGAKTLDDITFVTASGSRSFGFSCDSVSPSPQENGDPVLWMSRALISELQADFGMDLSAPLQNLDWLQGPQPTLAAGPANLTAILDHLTPPGNAQQIPPPPDLQDGRSGYADQPGYQQAIRAWTTTLDPDAVIAALVANPPQGMTGGAQPPGPGGKGPAETDASYKSVETATRIGPQLELSAIEEIPGTTTIEALAWQVDKTAKPVRDTVTGKVTSMNATWSEGNGVAQRVTGATAQRLADDINSLLVNNSGPPPACRPDAPAMTLTFRSSTGIHAFSDSCGLVQVLPAIGTVPELETSDALNLDVNTTFINLLPSPLPSSAPLPTASTAPVRSADEVITDAPATVSIETVQPVSKGKQRKTDQTFVVVGSRADKLLADLQGMRVYNGPAPLGCQPEMRTATIDVTQSGRRLHFQSYCNEVTVPGVNQDRTLSPAISLDNDLTADFAELTPVRSVDPPLDSSLQLELFTPTNDADTGQKSIAGTIAVTQDGVTIGTKQLTVYDQWTLPVRQGNYTVEATAPGYACGPPEVVAIYGHEATGASPSCKKN